MELYILNSLNQRTEVIDTYVSCIWTERKHTPGDIVLVMISSRDNTQRLPVGTRLAMNESNYIMVIETIEDYEDEQGRKLLKFIGPSLEDILDDRVAMGALDDLTTTPKWTLTGTPAEIMREIFHEICVDGILDAGDIIPNIIEDSFLPEGTIPESADEITVEIEPTTVLNVLRQLGEQYFLGFRFTRHPNTSQIYWDVYPGSDRTSQQSILPAVVFSPELDNLKNTSQLTSSAVYKNVAYVFSPVGYQVVYGQDVDPEVEGFARRVLVVKADDITSEVPEVAEAQMIQRGKDELAKYRLFAAFDGEITEDNAYVYGRDYFLNDLVEIRNTDGFGNYMRVTEQIFASDDQGYRKYPTLTLNTFITPGSWLGWNVNEEWDDLGSDEWADLP